jgi:hypothetical protein
MILRLLKSRRQQWFDSFRFNEIHRNNANGETCWKSVYCKTLGGVTLNESQATLYGIYYGQTLGQVFLQVLWFSPVGVGGSDDWPAAPRHSVVGGLL